MSTKEVYIHIGYHKCASTFLQENVFPYMKDIHYVYRGMKNKYDAVYGNIPLLCELKYGKNLISDEILSGSIYRDDPYASCFEMAKRLSKVYPNAHIILVKREMVSWLKSLYAQARSDAGRNISISDYDDWYTNYLDHDILRVDEYIQYLRGLFNYILVLDFDDLVKDNDSFIQRICDFMGVDFPVYNKKKKKVRLKEKHFRLIHLFGMLGLYRFNRYFLLGLLRRLNE